MNDKIRLKKDLSFESPLEIKEYNYYKENYKQCPVSEVSLGLIFIFVSLILIFVGLYVVYGHTELLKGVPISKTLFIFFLLTMFVDKTMDLFGVKHLIYKQPKSYEFNDFAELPLKEKEELYSRFNKNKKIINFIKKIEEQKRPLLRLDSQIIWEYYCNN